MNKYTYDFSRKDSTMTIFEGKHILCIMHDITQPKQAKILFQRYVEEREVKPI